MGLSVVAVVAKLHGVNVALQPKEYGLHIGVDLPSRCFEDSTIRFVVR